MVEFNVEDFIEDLKEGLNIERKNNIKLINIFRNYEISSMSELRKNIEKGVFKKEEEEALNVFFSIQSRNNNPNKFLINKIINKNKNNNKLKEFNNIVFKIGNPNTGKSYGFKEECLGLKGSNGIDYFYEKISVSGGVGNEDKGLQSSDLGIIYDVVNNEYKISNFLKVIMSAHLNPNSPHILFLDDFHNQPISALLSEYTPLFKGGEKIPHEYLNYIISEEKNQKIYEKSFDSIKYFNAFVELLRNKNNIEKYNKKAEKKINNIGNSKILNKGNQEESIELIFPDNLFLFCAGNYNRYTTQIFADWQDRASIQEISSLDEKIKENDLGVVKTNINKINEKIKEILQTDTFKIYDYEKYTFGIHKVNEETIEDEDSLLKFIFSMVKNSFEEHGNEHVLNDFATELIKSIIKDKIISLYHDQSKIQCSLYKEENKSSNISVNNSVLHQLNIYSQE